jgi:hypothetical protein
LNRGCFEAVLIKNTLRTLGVKVKFEVLGGLLPIKFAISKTNVFEFLIVDLSQFYKVDRPKTPTDSKATAMFLRGSFSLCNPCHIETSKVQAGP